MTHRNYVYRISNTKSNKHYYGSRTRKRRFSDNLLEDLKMYRSSSTDKEFKLDQIKNPQDYKYKIVKTFAERADTIKYEAKLHKKFNVSMNPKFYNLANQKDMGFELTQIIKCPHCIQHIDISNFTRWHGDKCFMLRGDKDIEWKLSKYPYMRKMMNKSTGSYEWVNLKFFNFDRNLYTTGNIDVCRCIINGKIQIILKSKAKHHMKINSKIYAILDKNNNVIEKDTLENLKMYSKYKNLIYESYYNKTSITFLHDKIQYQKAKTEGKLFLEGYKMVTEEEYNAKSYIKHDNNRITKITESCKLLIYRYIDNNLVVKEIPSIMFEEMYDLKIPHEHFTKRKEIKYNESHSSYKRMHELGYTKYIGWRFEKRKCNYIDILNMESHISLNM